MITVDCRCSCAKCRARTEDIYRMVGCCSNCGTRQILMLFRAGDPNYAADCPVCGNWHSVHSVRLATEEEIPAAGETLKPCAEGFHVAIDQEADPRVCRKCGFKWSWR